MHLKIFLNKFFNFIFLLILISCSTSQTLKNQNSKIYQNSIYLLEDSSGTFALNKILKQQKNEIISLNKIVDLNNPSLTLEKSVSVMEAGIIKDSKGENKTIIRPKIGQYSIWLDKKLYRSQISINYEAKQLEIIYNDPLKKGDQQEKYKIDEKGVYCFFNQITECLKAFKVHTKLKNKKLNSFSFFVILESYPFTKNIYNLNEYNIIKPASINYETKVNNYYRFNVNIDGQVLIYHLTPNNKLKDFYWTGQGISITGQKGIY